MNKEEIYIKFLEAKNTPSDINIHMDVLLEYANKCDHVTELGVRGVVSTWAFLASKASKVVAIDILNVWTPPVDKLQFICADDLEIEIEPTDMLLIDTRHCYVQLIQELNLHAPKVSKFIAMHDTAKGTFGWNGDDGGKGLLFAIEEFLYNNPNWVQEYHAENNNGMTILKRV